MGLKIIGVRSKLIAKKLILDLTPIILELTPFIRLSYKLFP